MPANPRQQTAQPPAPPTAKATAKYTNKDGSKFVTIPQATNTEPFETSLAMAQTTTKTNSQMPVPPAGPSSNTQTVNRKKQKRRDKQAAKLAAGQTVDALPNGTLTSSVSRGQMQELEARFRGQSFQDVYDDREQFNPADGDPYDTDEGEAFSPSYGRGGSPTNGYPLPVAKSTSKSAKKKKKSKGGQPEIADRFENVTNGLSHNHVSLPMPTLAPTNMPRGPGISKEKIWNTSSQEERERIKEFWLSLGEDERKSLVKVEKDAVLKKMKEQQKHSCSCTVCGRKRTAIEEELEVLYDAYYEELEQYANHQGDGAPPPMMPPPRRFGAVSGLQPPHRLPPVLNGQQPSRGRIVEQLGDDEDEEDDEEYSDQDVDEEEFSDEDEPEELPRSHATDFFNFGNSLTVQGGILTVADDLLKNDGKKFIEMMEQLAERRMAREEDAREQFANPNYGHPPNGGMHPHSHNHNHPPPPDDEEYDEEDEEEDEYDSGEDDYDEEEMDTMTEEQRMEEGRRMFQIFAARMFEQRVLTAYKEKVAKERQQKLLEELEEESRVDSQKKAKKAKDAQKKKDKMAEKKRLLAEEKAKREADKAAEEEALRVAEEKKAEEQRMRAEEKRKKKEAQRRAEEEERLKKETEKQKRLQEQRERQAEQERKQREAKEKERKEKEELRQREREAREAKEREAKERKEKLENEKREKESKAKSERDARDKQAREELAAQKAAAQAAHTAATLSLKKPQPAVPIPANLQSHSVSSPHVQVATPAIPKAPTPIKLRSSSQQESNSSIPVTPQTGGLSQNVSPVSSTPLQGSPGPIGPPGKNHNQPMLHHPQATSPIHSALKSPPSMQANPFGMPMGLGFQPGMPMMGPGFGGRMQHDPMFPHPQPMGGQFRPMGGPNGMPFHPMHQMPQGRGFPMQHPPPGFPQQMPPNLAAFTSPKEAGPPPPSHSRQQSGSIEKPFDSIAINSAQPIARPAPIGRPASIVHGQRPGESHDVDDLSNHLGSSALLDDSDEPLAPGAGMRRASAAPGSVGRQVFAPPPAPFGMENQGFASPVPQYGNTWGAPAPFGGSSLPGSGFWPTSTSFGSVGNSQPIRPSQSRSVTVRLMICRACKNLEGSTPDGYYDINALKEQVDLLNVGDQFVSEKELLDICETEGNAVNGGGSFDIRHGNNGHSSVRYEDDVQPSSRPVGAPGEIGSPIMGTVGMSRFPGPPPGF